MPGSRRSNEDSEEFPSKKPKLNNGLVVNHLKSFINDSLNNSRSHNDSLSSPMCDDSSRRISLSSRQINNRKSLNLLNKYDKDKHQSRKDSPSVPIDPNEFSITLNSVYEINSKAFNPSKAFNYNFINHIDSFVTTQVDFKLIGQSLDAGTRVYLSKVNLVLNNTHKMSSSLNMAIDDQKHDEDDEFLDDNLLPVAENKKKKKVRKKINTIATNVESLNGKLETNIEIDPLFHHLSDAFDVGNVNSLLMANLRVDNNGVMLLDSNASLNFKSTQAEKSTNSFSINDLAKVSFEEMYVCKYYRDFEFLKRDDNVDFDELTCKHTAQTDVDLSFNLNGDVDEINEPVDFDFGDHFNVNTSELDNISTNNVSDVSTDQFTDSEQPNILQILPLTNANNQFFNGNFLKRVFKNVYHFRDTNVKRNPNPKKKEQPENVYSEKVNEDLFRECKTNSYSDSIVSKWINESEDRHLENETGFEYKQIKSCFTRNCDFDNLYWKPEKKAMNQNSNIDLVDSFQEDGRHDFDSTVDDMAPIDFNLDSNTDKFDTEPIHIDALDIDYAKVSKNIDIKKVKFGMWDTIQKSTTIVSIINLFICQKNRLFIFFLFDKG